MRQQCTCFTTETPYQRKCQVFYFSVTSNQDLVPPWLCIYLTQGTWMNTRAMWRGYLLCVIQVASLNDLMIFCPQNLLLYITLLTFSSVTHLFAVRKGWHVAYFIDGMLCVLGSLLMCCNSLYSHYSTIRDLNVGLYMVIGRVLHRFLLL